MAASAREKIELKSTGKTKAGKPTGYSYTTDKNKRNTTDKLNRRRYDPRAYNPKTGKCGMHVLFKEKKIAK